jgi:hypothetical protein
VPVRPRKGIGVTVAGDPWGTLPSRGGRVTRDVCDVGVTEKPHPDARSSGAATHVEKRLSNTVAVGTGFAKNPDGVNTDRLDVG